MPATTPKGYPYPLTTDPLAHGAADIQALAQILDAREPWSVVQALADVPAANYNSFVITFPVGKFTTLPLISATASGSSLLNAGVLGTPTASGCTVYVRNNHTATVATSVKAHVIAHGRY